MSDYRKDLETNFDTLPENWRDHPGRFADWGEQHAHAMADRDRAKENLEVVKAELATEIRKDWAKLGFEKAPTVDAVNNWVILQPDYRTASDAYIDACEHANVMAVAKSAFEHRKKQLESLTQFLLMGIISSKPKLQGIEEPHGDEVQQGLNQSSTKKVLKKKRRRKS